jgi:hypothetical protein
MSTKISNPPPSIAAASRVLQTANAPASGCTCGCGDAREMDAGLCPIPTLQFPRFFAGQLVEPSDLNAIEQRVFSHEQLRGRHTIGWGVSCGFRVGLDGDALRDLTRVKGSTLRVEAGYAIDRYGRDVYMADDYAVSLETLLAERQARITKAMGDPWCAVPGCTPAPPTHFCVAVRYKECLADPVPSYAQQCGTPKTICEYSRVNECVEIRIFGDNEFPTLPVERDAGNWCGSRATDLVSKAAIFARLIKIPEGTTDVASTTGTADANAPSDLYTTLAGRVGVANEDRTSCLDLLHVARACDPCVAWPWIPLACFTIDDETVSAPDCRVRRTIYSLQELEAGLVGLFCAFEQLVASLASQRTGT